MTIAVSIFSKKAAGEGRVSTDSELRPLRKSVFLSIDFAAKAIKEALARRAPARSPAEADTPYSASAEVERLTTELANLERARLGLDPVGDAARTRVALDDQLSVDDDDPLARLDRGLSLGRAERDLVRVLLAWSAEPRIGLLFGHLHDALQRTRPTVGALGELLNDPVGVCVALDPAGALRRALVVDMQGNGPDATLGLEPRFAHWALSGEISPWTTPEGSLILLPPGPAPESAIAHAEHAGSEDAIVIRGVPGSGRRTVARAIAAREGRPLLHLELRAKEAPQALLAAAIRDARLLDARLLITGVMDERTAEQLVQSGIRLVLPLEPAAVLPAPLLGRRLALLMLDTPKAAERAAIFRAALGPQADEAAIRMVAERYAFTPGQIQRAAIQARTHGLDAACRLQLCHRLDEVGSRRPTKAHWDRLVLPEPALASLRALVSQVRQQVRVGEQWGFAQHHSLGHGVKALFFGKPGTGKTLAAEVIATDLGMPLYRIDIPKIVSKWIGETEQNLARVFDEAKQSQAVIFFDEADSLFGRRTAIETATDRYANMEVNYLLQRIEEHEGVVILATNLKANMDEGFARRLHYAVEFAEPDESGRAQIWRLSVPPGAPVHADVDFAQLARRFELSGGAIKNVVLGAAYLAAANDSPIRARHIGAALVREYTKLDRLYNRAELESLVGETTRSGLNAQRVP